MTELDRQIVFAPTLVDDPGRPGNRLRRFRKICKKGKGWWTSQKTAPIDDVYFFWFGGSTQAIVGLGFVKGAPEKDGKLKQWNCNYEPLVLLHPPITKQDITNDTILAKWWKTKPFHGWPKILPANVAQRFLDFVSEGNAKQRTVLKKLLTKSTPLTDTPGDGKDLGRLRKAAGWESDPKVRHAIEMHAMQKAEEHLKQRYPVYKIEDVHKNRSYDFECRSSKRKLFVEVKGSRNLVNAVTLTVNEVKFAQKNTSNMVLCVVHSIIILGGKKPKAKANSGTVVVYDKWAPDPEKMEALAYRCEL